MADVKQRIGELCLKNKEWSKWDCLKSVDAKFSWCKRKSSNKIVEWIEGKSSTWRMLTSLETFVEWI